MKISLVSLNKKKKSLLAAGMLAAGIALLSGCGGKGGAPTQKAIATDTLYVGMANAPDSFNPVNMPGAAGRYAMRFMFDALLTMPKVNEFGPGLANSIDTADNQTFTVKLNPNAKWSDGQPITAADVVFTLNLIANPKVETSLGTAISSLEGLTATGKLPEGTTAIPGLTAVDDHTVTFRTKTPVDPNFVKEFIGFQVLIVPKHVFEKIDPAGLANSEAATKPTVFSGPYKFVSYKTNDHLELAANDQYYKGKPKIAKIFLRVMNGTNLVTELQSGRIQTIAGGGIGNPPLQDIEVLKQNPNLDVKMVPDLSVQFMIANNNKFNVKFRQALTHAINRQQIVDKLFKGYAVAVSVPYSPASPYYDKNIETAKYDPALAKQLLAESGFDTSKEIVLTVPIGNTTREQSAALIEQDLQAIGLKVKEQKMDFATSLSNGKKGDYDLTLIGYTFYADPNISNYFAPGGGTNVSQANDPKLNELLRAGIASTTPAERHKIYDQIQEYMEDQQFGIALYSPEQPIIRNKALHANIGEYWNGSLYDLYNWTLVPGK